jgi:hypothetical protein
VNASPYDRLQSTLGGITVALLSVALTGCISVVERQAPVPRMALSQ